MISLISKRLVRRFKIETCPLDQSNRISINGIGQGCLYPSQMAQFVVKFEDQVPRIATAYVCEQVPHELLLGLDFMIAQNISFNPVADPDSLITELQVDGVPIASNQRSREGPDVYMSTRVPSVNFIHKDKPSKGQPTRPDPLLLDAFHAHLNELSLDQILEQLREVCDIDDESRDTLDNLFDNNKSVFSAQAYSPRPSVFASETEQLGADVTNVNTPPKASPLAHPQYHPNGIEWKLTDRQKQRVKELMEEFDDIYAETRSDVGKASRDEVVIKLIKKEPINCANYRTPLKYRDWLRQELINLLTAGIIDHSDSPWNSPALVVPKKLDNDGTVEDANKSEGMRLVIDYRKLNQVIENCTYPMPRVQDLITKYKNKKVFSVMDIRHAYYTIKLDPESMKVTAFSCEFGKFHFCFLPQGLKISPAIFQQTISTVLSHLEHSDAYLDDICTASVDVDGHIDELRETFQAIRDSGFKLKKSKCVFFRRQVSYIGHLVGEDGVRIDPDKLEHVKKMTLPETVGDARSCMGFTGFMREHVPYYADVTEPIQRLISDGKGKAAAKVDSFITDKHHKALALLKEMLLCNEVLAFPDPSLPFDLFTDASKKHMAAVLMQQGKVVGYFARSFHGTQLDWAAIVKEAYAVYRGIEHFAVYLTGAQVNLKCDHKPLESFLHGRTKNMMVNRWSLNLQEYDISFGWVATDKNLSDYLSRMIEDGLYEPHEPITAQTEFPASAKGGKEEVVAQICAARIQSFEMPRALQNRDMVEIQRKDAYCRRIRKQLAFSEQLREQFVEENGLLYKIVTIKDGLHLALVIPRIHGLTVIANTHLEMQHAGEHKTMDLVRSRVFWKKLSKDVRNFVSSCRTCQIKNLRADSYSYLHDVPPSIPFARIAVDLSYGFCTSAQGNNVVLTAICLLTSYPFAVPIKDRTAKSVAAAFQQILNQTCACTEVLSDNGPEFTSKEFRALVTARGIKHVTTAPYSPQSNAVKERWHRYMNEVIRVSASTLEENAWEEAIEAALHAYRCLPHTTTGESPYFLVHGYDPKIAVDQILPTLTRSYGDRFTSRGRVERLRLAHNLALKNISLARKKFKNPKISVPEEPLKVGDLVLHRVHGGRKSQPVWEDGYRLIKFESTRTVRLEHTVTGVKKRSALTDVKRTDPLSLLLNNSHMAKFPGAVKLYIQEDSVKDLCWPDLIIEEAPAPENSNDHSYSHVSAPVDPSVVGMDHDYSRPAVPVPRVVDPHAADDDLPRKPRGPKPRRATAKKQAHFDRPYLPPRHRKPKRDPDFVYCSDTLVGSISASTLLVCPLTAIHPTRSIYRRRTN